MTLKKRGLGVAALFAATLLAPQIAAAQYPGGGTGGGGYPGSITGGVTAGATAGTTAGTTPGTTAGTTAGSTGPAPQNYIAHSVANHYIEVDEAEAGTQTVGYRGTNTGTNVDLKGKWIVLATAGDPFHLGQTEQPITLRYPGTINTPYYGAGYGVLLVDTARNDQSGTIPGTGVTTKQDTSTPSGGGSTGGTGGAPGMTSGSIPGGAVTGGGTTAGGTGTVSGPHAILVGTGGFQPIATSGALNNQFPKEHLSSRTISLVWVDPSSQVAVIQYLTLLRDMVRVQYTLYNEDFTTHRVGFKLVIVPGTSPPVATLLSNGSGNTSLGYFYVPGKGLQLSEGQLDGGDVPSQLLAYDALPNYTIASRLITRGQGATPPDHIILGDGAAALDASSTQYVYNFNASTNIRDSVGGAILEYWDPVQLAPKQQRTIVQYYGLAGAAEDLQPPFVLATEAPNALSYQELSSASSTTATGQAAPNAQFGNSPLNIKGFVYNVSGFRTDPDAVRMLQELDQPGQTMDNASATLLLPGVPGAVLDPTESLSQSGGQVPNQEEAQFNWDVNFAGTVPPGPFTYGVAGGGTPLGQKTVYNRVEVPAQPDYLTLQPGWQMLTFPYLQNVQARTQYAFSALFPLLAQGGAYLARWNPQTSTYQFFSAGQINSFVANAVPGESYWVYLPTTAGTTGSAITIPLGSSTTPPLPENLYSTTGGLSSVSVSIYRGWNQIGDPYVYSEPLGSMNIVYQGAAYTFQQALARGIISSPVLWYWVPDPNNSQGGSYRYLIAGENSELTPYQGYWIESAYDNVSVEFTSPAIPNAQIIPPGSTGGSGLGR